MGEIGSGSSIPESGMEDSDTMPLGRAEVLAVDPLMTPDLLKPTFWEGFRGKIRESARRRAKPRPTPIESILEISHSH